MAGRVLFCLLVFMAAADTHAVVWHVNRAQTAPGDGTSWATAFNTLQDGIDAAAAAGGGSVWVAEGVYDELRINLSGALMLQPLVTLLGGFTGTESTAGARDWTAHETIIDGSTARDGHPAYHVVIGADNAVLDGFTITGGQSVAGTSENEGGGLVMDGVSPTITHCIIRGNSAEFSGGFSILNGAAPQLSRCTIQSNLASVNSGAGAIYTNASPTLTDCVFLNNTAGRLGGALVVGAGSQPIINRCLFQDNVAERMGGAVCCYQNGLPTLINCIFTGNGTHEASFGGGAIGNYVSEATLVNCTLVGNISANLAGGIGNWGASTTHLINCILWNNAPNDIEDYSGTTDASHCDISDGYAGEGNINADPLFVDAAAGDFRLQAESPCIDVGIGDTAPNSDYALDPRPVDVPCVGANGTGIEYDLGAYEYQSTAGTACEGEGEGEETGHTVTVELSNVDDRADVYLNEVLLLHSEWGWDETDSYDAHHAGYTGERAVDCARLLGGDNRFDFLVWNAAVCCSVSAHLTIRLDGVAVYDEDFVQSDSTEGFKFSDSFVLDWSGPCAAEGEGEGETCGSLSTCQAACASAADTDADGDGLRACVENCACTSDTALDTDGDGMPDAWELQYGLNPAMDDAARDLDADGRSGLEEFLEGSSPIDRHDPNATVYVAPPPFGDDAGGDGSLTAPWATIAHALVQVASYAAPQIIALEGAYAEAVALQPGMTLSGVQDGETRIAGTITGADNAVLKDLTLAGSGAAGAMLNMNNVVMRITRVNFVGAPGGETGILVNGTKPAASIIEESSFSAMAIGVDIAQAIPLIRRTVFKDLGESAIILRATETAVDGTLGDATGPTAGCNTFSLSIAGPAVVNERSSTVKMELNDWGTDDASAIADRIEGAADFEPFLATGSGVLATSLYCTVWDAATQGRVLNAAVQLAPGLYSTVTQNVQGVYSFPAVPQGAYTLHVTAPDYDSSSLSVVTVSGQQKSVIVALSTGGTETPDGCQCNHSEKRLPGLDQVFLAGFTVAMLFLSRRWTGLP